MAQIETYDPWESYNKGMQNLGQTFTDIENMQYLRQKRAREEAEYQRTEETRRGLAQIMAKSAEKSREQYDVPNPDYETYQTLKAAQVGPPVATPQIDTLPGSNKEVALGTDYVYPGSDITLPATEPPQTLAAFREVPKYSRDQLMQEGADYLTSRGDFAGLKGLENAMDITSRIDERGQKMITGFMTQMKNLHDQNFGDDYKRAAAKALIQNLNDVSRRQVIDPATADKLKFSADGNVMFTESPDGHMLAYALDKNRNVTHITQLDVKGKDNKYESKIYEGTLKGQGGRDERYQYKYIFPSEKKIKEWEANGSVPDKAREYGAEFKLVNQVAPAPASIIMPKQEKRSERPDGIVTSGPYKGLTAYKDSHGGPPFVYNTNGDKINVAGIPLDRRNMMAAYATDEDETGLTPAQKQANLKSQNDPTAMRIVKRIDGVIPVLNQIKTQFASLPNETGFVPLNQFLRSANVMMGNVKIDSYDVFVKEATREVQSALSGNQSSQKLVLQQIDTLKSAKTNAQRAAAIDAIITTLSERKNSELSKPYKEKTPAKGVGGGRTVVKTGTYNGRKVIQYSDGSTEYAQ